MLKKTYLPCTRFAGHFKWNTAASFFLILYLTVCSCDRSNPYLPPLDPIPEISPPLEENSVEMGNPEEYPEIKLDFPIATGPFEPTWESIAANYPDTPGWLREDKFGIWVHFGAQSAGRSGDWYAKRMYMQDGQFSQHYSNHLKDFGHPSEAGYKDILHHWNPEKLDPKALVQAYHDAGARFLIIQGVHHDNFDNWDSRYQPWNSVNLGPHRDLLDEWSAAARSLGMHYGVSFHHEYTWWWYQPAFGSDATGPFAGVPYDANLTTADGIGTWWEGYDPRLLYTINLREYKGLDVEFAPAGGIFTRHQEYANWYATWWALRIMDVIENYDPDFIYTDGNSSGPFSGHKSGTGTKNDAIQRVMAHYYNRTLKKRGEVNTFSVVKFSPPRNGIISTKEGSYPSDVQSYPSFIAETAVGDWFYSPGFVYDPGAVIRYMVENVSRDGAVAVCISLLPDGSLDEGSSILLSEIGEWMKINGEAIYGSRAWERFGEGDSINGKLLSVPKGKIGQKQADFTFSTRDFRFTVGKDRALYAFCMTVPEPGEELVIKSLAASCEENNRIILDVALLGSDVKLRWKMTEDGLHIIYPDNRDLKISSVFKIYCL